VKFLIQSNRTLKHFVLVATVALAAACSVKETTKVSSLPFEQKTFSQQSSHCGVDSAVCARYEVSYPVFDGLDTATLHLIESEINRYVSMGNPNAEGWNMEQIATDFIKGYEDFTLKNPELSTGEWYYKANVKPEIISDTLISLSVTDEYFTGGAHGGAGTYFINVSPATKKQYTLDDLLKSGYEDTLLKEAEKEFREVRNLADTASFTNNGFEFTENQFELTPNYGFVPEGVIFVYNSYEVAAYAVGPTQIIVPYERLKDWLKKANPL
jgi:hypothetical protein